MALWSDLLLRELSVGRGSTATLGGGSMPKIHTVEPWDGKDGQVVDNHCGVLLNVWMIVGLRCRSSV